MIKEWREAAYQSYLSSFYQNYNALDENSYKSIIPLYEQLWSEVLPTDKTVNCLDLGCGPGKFLHYLQYKGFKQVEGVDRAPENTVIHQRMNLKVTNENALDFLEDAIEAGKRYQLVTAFDVIEHLSKQELFDLLVKVHAVLDEQGRMLVKTVNASSIIGSYARYIDITHELAFTEESLQQIFFSAGFPKVQLVQPKARGTKQVVRRFIKRGLHWVLYRLIEGHYVPTCVDIDIMAVAWRNEKNQ